MSKRNTFESKAERREDRKHEQLIDRGLQRIPVSTVPPSVLLNILCNPKNKSSSKARRRLMRSRDVVVVVERDTPKRADAYFARKAEEMEWHKLARKEFRVARRQKNITRLLTELAPGSKFRAPLEAELSILNIVSKSISHEFKNRLNS